MAVLRTWLGPLAMVLGLTACGGPVERSLGSDAQSAELARAGTAIFAAGCFWCVEEAFDAVPGVIDTESGYIGGHVSNPSYRQVTAGGTGHTEAVRVRFDPQAVSYDELLGVFWRNVDPTDAGGQFCDRGSSYRSGIFFLDADQERRARASRATLENDPAAPSPIVTEITAATTFYPAEDYHQGYYLRNPLRYAYYKRACGRAARLEALWGPAG